MLIKSTFSDSHDCPLYTGLEGRHGRVVVGFTTTYAINAYNR